MRVKGHHEIFRGGAVAQETLLKDLRLHSLLGLILLMLINHALYLKSTKLNLQFSVFD